MPSRPRSGPKTSARRDLLASREELLADPRSGVTRGAARGGTGARHGQPDVPEPRTEPLPPADDVADDDAGDRPPAQRPPGGPASSKPTSSRAGSPTSRTSTVTQQGAGLLVAAFAWPIGVNLLKGGPGAMWGWIKAKFINQPYSGPGASPNTSGVGMPPG